MRRPTRSARLVTLCVRGKPANRPSRNANRLILLRTALAQLRSRDWGPIDAVILPGGFFRIRRFIGHLPDRQRAPRLAREPVVRAAIGLCAALEEYSPGAVLLFGVDGDVRSWAERGDQFCLACTSKGIVALARKIFPNPGETRDWVRWYVPSVNDYAAGERFLTLANGSRAVLCVCYDAFGLAEHPTAPSARTRAIRELFCHGGQIETGDPEFTTLRRACIAAWQKKLARERPRLAIATLHKFAAPGREIYWQRHGIAIASAALGGGLALGAAHFLRRLPSLREAPLAALGVPDRHRFAGPHRQSCELLPIDSADVEAGTLSGVLRLYRV
jgi:hypothetical protein